LGGGGSRTANDNRRSANSRSIRSMPTGKRVRLVGIVTSEVDVGGMGMLKGWMDDGGESASTRSEQDLA
jgi:hypothetical protein